MAHLSRLIIFCRGNAGLLKTTQFFNSSLALPVVRTTDNFAELRCARSGVNLTLQATEDETQLSSSYSPIMTFEVPEMDETIAAAVTAGGIMDGPVKFKEFGRVAQVRVGEGGVMVGFFERA